ncbi:MAG: dienelactone hydrolase family protein [Gemmataceae bacterium]
MTLFFPAPSRFWILLFLATSAAGCGVSSGPQPAPVPRDGEPITFPTPLGMGLGKWFPPPEGDPRVPAIVVLHGDHGLTSTVEHYARDLAGRGFAVVCLDLYHGEKIDSLLDAHIMDRGLPEERVHADVRGAVDWLAARSEVDPRRMGMVGWEMGASHALETALLDSRFSALVVCYGRVITDPDQLRPLRANVLALFAGKDEGNPPETRAAFARAMSDAGKSLNLEVFDESDHGFMNPPKGTIPSAEDTKAAEKAWSRILTFFLHEWPR